MNDDCRCSDASVWSTRSVPCADDGVRCWMWMCWSGCWNSRSDDYCGGLPWSDAIGSFARILRTHSPCLQRGAEGEGRGRIQTGIIPEWIVFRIYCIKHIIAGSLEFNEGGRGRGRVRCRGENLNSRPERKRSILIALDTKNGHRIHTHWNMQ